MLSSDEESIHLPCVNKKGGYCKRPVHQYGDRCHLHSGIDISYEYGFYPYPVFWVGESANELAKDLLSKDSKKRKEAGIKLRGAYKTYIHQNYTLKICLNGLVLVSIHSINQDIYKSKITSREKPWSTWSVISRAWSSYLNIFNVLYFLLGCAQSKNSKGAYYHYQFFELKKHDICRITLENDIPTRQMWYGHEPKAALARRGMFRLEAKEDEVTKSTSPIEIFNKLDRLFEKVMENRDLFDAISYIAKAMSEHLLGNCNLSIILNWVYLEDYYKATLKDYLKDINETYSDGKKRIKKERMRRFCGREFPMLRVIDQLEVFGLISKSELDKINHFRNIRNEVTHNLTSSEEVASLYEGSREILKFIREILNRKYEIDFALAMSEHSTTGL